MQSVLFPLHRSWAPQSKKRLKCRHFGLRVTCLHLFWCFFGTGGQVPILTYPICAGLLFPYLGENWSLQRKATWFLTKRSKASVSHFPDGITRTRPLMLLISDFSRVRVDRPTLFFSKSESGKSVAGINCYLR